MLRLLKVENFNLFLEKMNQTLILIIYNKDHQKHFLIFLFFLESMSFLEAYPFAFFIDGFYWSGFLTVFVFRSILFGWSSRTWDGSGVNSFYFVNFFILRRFWLWPWKPSPSFFMFPLELFWEEDIFVELIQ